MTRMTQSVAEVPAEHTAGQVWPSQVLALSWTWRDREGGHWRTCDMETRHLFFTLRMIWNHTMPAYMRVGYNVRFYSFGPHYTKEYMRSAVGMIGSELSRRNDLSSSQKRELAEMASHLRGHPELLVAPKLALERTASNIARSQGDE